jgi:hypothetical protein
MIRLKSLLREDPASDVQTLITKVKNYDEFVSKLGDLAQDPKVQAFIKSGKADGDLTDDKLNAVHTSIHVKDLRPTQNEIDVDGSLKWPLTKPESLRSYLQKGVVTIKAPIVVYNGAYIIDGHHRWSQLYAMNKEAVIDAIDLQGPSMNPIDVLKIVQLAIAGELGKVPTATVKGRNLLNEPGDFIAKYTVDTIIPECIEVFKKMRGVTLGTVSKQTIAGKIVVPNVMEMQKTSQPVPGAPKRSVMPQTDDAKDAMLNISKGIVNFNAPYQKESVQMIKLIDLLKEDEAPKCPIATQNVEVNLKHRQLAIDKYGYGPLNPNNPNIKFWKEKARIWKLATIEEAKSARCNSCAAFNITTRILNCIGAGLASGEKSVEPQQSEPNTQPQRQPDVPVEENLISEIATLGFSGIKRFAAKHGFSVKSKMSGGRVPYVTITKDGKSYGPFDPTITTLTSLQKRVGIVTEDEIPEQPAPEPETDDTENVGEQDAWETIEAGKLGYCTMHKFKCAGSRTCNAWIEGGPVKDK